MFFYYNDGSRPLSDFYYNTLSVQSGYSRNADNSYTCNGYATIELPNLSELYGRCSMQCSTNAYIVAGSYYFLWGSNKTSLIAGSFGIRSTSNNYLGYYNSYSNGNQTSISPYATGGQFFDVYFHLKPSTTTSSADGIVYITVNDNIVYDLSNVNTVNFNRNYIMFGGNTAYNKISNIILSDVDIPILKDYTFENQLLVPFDFSSSNITSDMLVSNGQYYTNEVGKKISIDLSLLKQQYAFYKLKGLILQGEEQMLGVENFGVQPFVVIGNDTILGESYVPSSSLVDNQSYVSISGDYALYEVDSIQSGWQTVETVGG